MRAKILTAGLLAVLLGTTALADTSSMNADVAGMGILQNEWVKAGVNGTTGTLGSGNGTSPGLLFDPTGTGTFNPSYDYLTPGSPFDGFAVKVDGTNYYNNNAGNAANIANDGNGLTDGTNSLSWTGGVTGVFDITNTFTLAPATPYIDITSSITMGVAASTLSFGKYIDPDSQGMPGDSSSTDNVLGYGVIPTTNVAFSEATTSRYALGIYTTDTNVTAGINGWSREADGYNGTSYTDADGNPVNYGNSDDTIGISWSWTDVSAGDILTASYAYIFGPSAFDAANSAVTGGAGGGADVSSWGTLEDVGSATDAASGGSTPTLVSTSTETITSTSEAVSSTLPVLTASITHHESSVASGVQTIDRETTTSVTTPVEVTTTSFDRTTETYSDSSTVVTDGTATSTVAIRNDVVTTITDPGSFVGRMDQGSQLANLDVARNLGFANGIGGGRISHTMGNGYSAESTVWGLGHTIVAENGMRITGGVNFADTTLTGTGSSGAMSTTHFGIEVGKALDNRDLTVSASGNIANSDISWDRNIGTFAAHGETSVSDTWGTLKVEKSTGAVRPWVGYTIGSKTTDGYSETGDIQAVLEGVTVDSSYNYATIGLNVEAGILDFGVSKAFDANDTTNISVGINKNINDRIAIGASANRTMSGDNESTFLTAGLRIKF